MEEDAVLVIVKKNTGEEIIGRTPNMSALCSGFNPHYSGNTTVPIITFYKPLMVVALRMQDGSYGKTMTPYMFGSPKAPLYLYQTEISCYIDEIDPEFAERYEAATNPRKVEVATPETTKMILGL